MAKLDKMFMEGKVKEHNVSNNLEGKVKEHNVSNNFKQILVRSQLDEEYVQINKPSHLASFILAYSKVIMNNVSTALLSCMQLHGWVLLPLDAVRRM